MWIERAYLLLPLLAAVLYALAALALKAATALGFDAVRITVATNWVAAAAFLTFVPWGQPAWWPHVWGPPLALGAAFLVGQIFTVLALTRGDVSVATPLLGTKSALVAFFLAVVARAEVSIQVWVAAGATVSGIALIQHSAGKGRSRHTAITMVYSLLAAGGFGLFDVLNQVWSKQYGYGRVVPPAIAVAAFLSLGLLRLADRPSSRRTGVAYGYLIAGVALLTVQSLILITTIGKAGDAAGCNIVYGSRGLWSILLVWIIGNWFGNQELLANARIVTWRLAGAALILFGVILVFAR